MIHKFKPALHRKWLILLSGIMWSGVGIMLNMFAYRWFSEIGEEKLFFVIPGGLILGLIIALFGFGKMAGKNITRILQYSERVCVFAFQRWQTYILIAVMMSMGIFMRTTNIIPKFLLAPMYIGIGTALFLASFHYYRIFFNCPEKNTQV